VFTTSINLGLDNVRLSDEGVHGDCIFRYVQINLCNDYKGEKTSDCSGLDTFYHEKCILF
jgi:hypothetical protein